MINGIKLNAFLLSLVVSFTLSHSLFAQVIFYNNGADIIINNGATVIAKTASLDNATGNFLNAGTLIVEQDLINNDFLSSGGADGHFRVYGDWINNAVFESDSGEVELSGGNQLITGTSITSFHNLTLTGSDVKTMTIDAFVTNHLELNNYELATDTNLLSVTNTDPQSITFIDGFVSSEGIGRLLRVLDSADDYIFPVGSSAGVTRYRPVIVNTQTVDIHEFAVRHANVDPNTEGYDRAQLDTSICRVNPDFFHYIERRVGNSETDLSIFYDPVTDGNWTVNAYWTNSLWAVADPSQQLTPGPLNHVTTSDWDDFSNSIFALAHPGLLIDFDNSTVQHVSCYSGNDGLIDIEISTGELPIDFEWSIGGSNQTIDDLIAGNYTVTLTDAKNCERIQSFTINQPNRLVVSETVSSVSCVNGSDGIIVLDITGGTPGYQIDWPTTDTGLVATDLPQGVYTVLVTDNNGCLTEVEVEVDELPELIASITAQGISCYGFDDAVLTASVDGGTPVYNYIWIETGDDSVTVQNISPGIYTLLVEDVNGCQSEVTVEVFEPAAVTGEISEDKIIAAGQSAEIYAEGTGGTAPFDYVWTPDESLNDNNSPVVIATPEHTTTYQVTITDVNGCSFVDSLLIIVDQILYDFPTAFVPGGYNNTFYVLKSQTVEVRSFQVFNRWGRLIHDNASGGWDGTFKGELQPMDTYVYQATLLLPDGTEVTESGHFVLIW